MRSHELFEPFLKALSSTQKSAMKIVLWSSVAAFFELCMLAAFIPLIGVITNQPIPDFLAFGLSVDSFINSYSAFLVLFILSAIALRMYAQYSLIAFGYGIAEKVSTQQLTYAPQHKTDQDQSDIVRSVIAESDNFGANYVIPLLTVVVRAIFLGTLLIMSGFFYPLATISGLALVIVGFIALRRPLNRLLTRFGDKRYLANKGRFSHALSLVQNRNVFKFYKVLSKAEKNFEKSAIEYRKSQSAQQLFMITPRLLIEGIFFLVFLASIYLSTLDTGLAFKAEDLVLAFGVVLRGIPSFQILIQNLNLVRFNLNAAKDVVTRFSSTLPSESSLHDRSNTSFDLKNGDLICIYDYTYSTGSFCISGDPIEFRLGENVLVYGKSGSGKTTLVQLLIGSLDFEFVSISVNGNNINSDKFFNELRTRSGFAPQNSALVKGTILDNLFLNRRHEELDSNCLDIASSSACLDFVDDPYSFEIKEGGLNLSGGEGQRVNIMRALYHSELVCFSDEMTSSLDIETERRIITRIIKNYPEISFVTVSHRNLSELGFSKHFEVIDGLVGYR
jgi:ABC-type multidrug transport system fused ATPase/permease subunit